ncbi:alpha/beta hydrolase [Sneathiella glossodoripedis]|uniref:alpha/beta hydrolase n=1 Tax=Sneathiella glossodoripedis TaxID=418853 RepID=UPI001902C0EA|nr:hypothetical protein [Sneathiella glossodoripedis]
MTELELTSTDGLKLHVYKWLPETEPVAIIHIAHGMAEHAKRYERFAKALNAAASPFMRGIIAGMANRYHKVRRPGTWLIAMVGLKRLTTCV